MTFWATLVLAAGCARRSTEVLLPPGEGPSVGDAGVVIKLDVRPGQAWEVGGAAWDGQMGCTGTPELCNGIDDDCDGVIDNDFDLLSDPLNCGACGIVCSAPTAMTGCVLGQCQITACTPGYVDADGQEANGCECMVTNGGVEICDGADNDCDGVVDEGYDLQHDPSNCGACGVVCAAANGDPFCSGGACAYACQPGYHDVNLQADDGCEYECRETANSREICDGVDNDCNGLVDGDDLGLLYDPADRTCYSNASGACQAGLLTCIAARMVCVGAGPASEEICDGRDNDCDGQVDESDANLGRACYTSGLAGCDLGTGLCQGACRIGAYVCADGHLTCGGQVSPTLELCNGIDDDCDGVVDNGIDTDTDPNNCGGCGHACGFANAFGVCVDGVCVLDEKNHQGACVAGWVNQNGDPADGCEYACTPNGPETCDGVDNDCNGFTDRDDPGLVYPLNFCLQIGECAKGPGGATHPAFQASATYPVCTVPAGAPPGTRPSWICNYPASVQLVAPNQVVAQESWCDGLDNDCNGVADDPYRAVLGTSCADPGSTAVGACLPTGTWRCQANALVCDLSGAVTSLPADEICDGVDNDCDGVVDESWDNPEGLLPCQGRDCRGVRDDVVHVNTSGAPGDYYIYRFEASRPDASTTTQGTAAARACSRRVDGQGGAVLPWSGVTWNQADAACRAGGMRLCRATRAAGQLLSDEWGFACQAGLTCAEGSYPYGCGYSASACNGVDRALGQVETCGAQSGCVTIGELDAAGGDDQVYDLSGNLAEWTDDRRDIPDTTGSPAGAGSATAIYTVRGGGYDSFFRGMACDFTGTQLHPTFSFANTGFRCCSSCPPGTADCGGSCVNLGRDPAHCGGCGLPCAAGTACHNGTCR
jgi:hypothetical protein